VVELGGIVVAEGAGAGAAADGVALPGEATGCEVGGGVAGEGAVARVL
jgi:hypothetical protein